MTDDTTNQPGPGQDSKVDDWFGQSVARDAEVAETLTDELGEDEAEKVFEQTATGEDEQDARHEREVVDDPVHRC